MDFNAFTHWHVAEDDGQPTTVVYFPRNINSVLKMIMVSSFVTELEGLGSIPGRGRGSSTRLRVQTGSGPIQLPIQ